MEPTVTPCDASFGAVVTDIDLSKPDELPWDLIDAAFLEHALLIFPGQHLESGDQVAFAEHFGSIELLTPNPDMKAVPLSNVTKEGELADEKLDFVQVLRGNEGWHTDSSYMRLAAKASVLSARVVPADGGGTEWADMRAAYESLDEETKARIEGLSAYHSIYYSQARMGHEAKPGAGYGFHEEGQPLRPLVKIHPETGRPALCIGRHAHDIPGLSPDESEALLDGLLDFACRPPRTIEHAWQPGDVALWDNRCLLHRARPYTRSEPRVMVHVRVAGDPQSERAETMAEDRFVAAESTAG